MAQRARGSQPMSGSRSWLSIVPVDMPPRVNLPVALDLRWAICATPPVHGILRPSCVHPAVFTYLLPDDVSFAEAAMVKPLAAGGSDRGPKTLICAEHLGALHSGQMGFDIDPVKVHLCVREFDTWSNLGPNRAVGKQNASDASRHL